MRHESRSRKASAIIVDMYNRAMAEPADAARYHRLQLRLAIARLTLTLAYFLVILASGAGHRLAEAAAGITISSALRVALVAIALGALHTLLGFPLAWLGGFHWPRRFGLLHQPLRGWR